MLEIVTSFLGFPSSLPKHLKTKAIEPKFWELKFFFQIARLFFISRVNYQMKPMQCFLLSWVHYFLEFLDSFKKSWFQKEGIIAKKTQFGPQGLWFVYKMIKIVITFVHVIISFYILKVVPIFNLLDTWLYDVKLFTYEPL